MIGDIKEYGKLNINGFEVTLKFVNAGKINWFCSYVTLPNSEYLDESLLNYPTYREADTIGFDTAHAYNIEQPIERKLLDALHQAEGAIKRYLEINKK